jgi:hypothetical protein
MEILSAAVAATIDEDGFAQVPRLSSKLEMVKIITSSNNNQQQVAQPLMRPDTNIKAMIMKVK